ncbi:MAG: alkaline phosphatase family protein [Acidimicrobiales bacterium]
MVWIWMENRSYPSIIGSPSAPYENRLARQCGLATNYHAVTHPSLPNYLAATGGSTAGVSTDVVPGSTHITSGSIFSQLTKAGRTWMAYDESMPHNCALSPSGEYAVRHNPAAYYLDIRSQCATRDVPLGTTSSGAWPKAASGDSLPSFSFVTPNLIHDMHDGSVAQGDAWLQGFLTAFLKSPAYRAGHTVVFVTWDEGESDNHVATIVVAPSTPAGTRSGRRFTHYSLLRTAEDLLGLPPLGQAASAAPMVSAFHL